jgi:hypothetical protein
MLMSSIFWDIMPCSPLKVNRRFGGTYRVHLQGQHQLVRQNITGKNANYFDLCLFGYGSQFWGGPHVTEFDSQNSKIQLEIESAKGKLVASENVPVATGDHPFWSDNTV